MATFFTGQTVSILKLIFRLCHSLHVDLNDMAVSHSNGLPEALTWTPKEGLECYENWLR